jgi:hypothetical protein
MIDRLKGQKGIWYRSDFGARGRAGIRTRAILIYMESYWNCFR